ncbi:type IV pilus modification protein PilV [Shewanella sp. FDAARGOS_354]|uniref:type IV pilus modification protein PilV n=1 Tax=Shewanella sp. FDAARGOS_354 TaxID=1930557 RepID=UPI000B516F4D|nr:type IV pilus modification protein PilV [Shewanella sp. FDAARGOS_354]ASF17341.1 type IV pilus modification protein PilV [Shewanella sp. FDAARGOS_354]
MTKFERLTHQGFQRGFSLIEVLVALVILVIGLIGIFNLHIVAKRASFESYQQTQASYYANDIVNRMKLNPSELAKYVGNHSGSKEPITPVTPACEGANLCTPSQLALWDLYQWRSAFSGEYEIVGAQQVGGLETALGCIKLNGNIVTVTITWLGINEISGVTGTFDCGTASKRRRAFTMTTVI